MASRFRSCRITAERAGGVASTAEDELKKSDVRPDLASLILNVTIV